MSLLDDPEYLPFKLDLAGRRVLLLRLPAQQRADATFLDERALPANPQTVWVPLSLVAELPIQSATPPADFIFHIGHCGSTLLSRLLQSWSELQVLREPLPLRTLATAYDDNNAAEHGDIDGLLQHLIALWNRPLPPLQRTVIKATSSCNGLIAPILQGQQSRALLLDVSLASYLATLFKSPGSIADAIAAESGRVAYLQRRGAQCTLHASSAAERCARSWVAEQLRFHELSKSILATRVLRIDFEKLLAEPRELLVAMAAHLQLPNEGLTAALASPAWLRYSKDDAYAYDASDRQHDLALAQHRFASEIDAGLQWCKEFVQHNPQFASALQRG